MVLLGLCMTEFDQEDLQYIFRRAGLKTGLGLISLDFTVLLPNPFVPLQTFLGLINLLIFFNGYIKKRKMGTSRT